MLLRRPCTYKDHAVDAPVQFHAPADCMHLAQPELRKGPTVGYPPRLSDQLSWWLQFRPTPCMPSCYQSVWVLLHFERPKLSGTQTARLPSSESYRTPGRALHSTAFSVDNVPLACFTLLAPLCVAAPVPAASALQGPPRGDQQAVERQDL